MNTLPAYVRYSLGLLGLFLTIQGLIVAKEVLIPLAIALVLALLLVPLSRRLEHWHIPRSLATLISILAILILLGTTVYLFSTQVDKIIRELPAIQSKLEKAIEKGHDFLEKHLQMEQEEQTAYIKDTLGSMLQNSSGLLRSTFSFTTGLLNYLIIVPISLFFMLFYRSFFKEFIYKLTDRSRHDRMARILSNVQQVMQQYIVGLFTVVLIVAVLNSVGLTILGVPHAIFFGSLASLLTIIPYVGIFIGSLLPIAYVLLTQDSLGLALGVALVFWVVQILEGNFITPNVVGNSVSLNPFVAIIGLIVGGQIWGAAGMILFIPFLAMLKVVFDAIDHLRPYGFILGTPVVENEQKVRREWRLRLRRWLKK
jgi:predicted PurR-regulated permease PerM